MKFLPKSLHIPKEIQIKQADMVTFLGFLASVGGTFCIFHEKFYWAYLLIVTQLITDFFDGRMARNAKSSNSFGANLDSFADFYNIVNTALLGFFMGMSHPTAYFVLGWFIFAGMLRLSIFAIVGTGDDGYFRGVPTTLTTGLLSTFLLLNFHFDFININAFIFVFLIFAILMPSSVKIKKI